MKIAFTSAAAAGPVARIVDQDALPSGLEAALVEGARASRFSGKAGQLYEGFVSRGDSVVRVALAGAGDAAARDRLAALEKAGAALSAKFGASGEAALNLDLTGSALSAAEVAAVLLGLRLRAWRYDLYRTRMPEEQKATLAQVNVIGAPDGSAAAWAVESALADGVELTRELVTEPANVIYPESFVARVSARLDGTGIKLRVLDDAEMTTLGMGALLGVAQGSVRPARILAMEWNGGKAGERPTAFVGKGVTFDTGGISLKPAAGMEDMKWDMGGAGAVAGAMLALARRGAKANVIGICGLVENMPDGKAQRPGDVVTSMSGQTIEVINTDAEGRLVLCDAITWTQKEYNPAAIVDLATLTGAMIISLGNEHGGIFANDDGLAAKLIAAGDASGDRLWRMPMGPAYDKLIDSPIADMKNVGPREGGSITAAQFIQRFVDKDRPWAHLDIAGMVWASKPGATWDKGATGYGVRVLDRFVRDNLEG
ncbi:leucyl aminopeptidase [Novosphingobium aquiterrae]|uniref:Probable cytosol aminopeptidase n=1 Tax=Novosphingobium aquiterrae TaxID=624388 RepID=A0ABV6PE99_9SPHN